MKKTLETYLMPFVYMLYSHLQRHNDKDAGRKTHDKDAGRTSLEKYSPLTLLKG